MFRKPAPKERHINPRFRAFGKARIDIAIRSTSQEDWDRLWKPSTFPFPFQWAGRWKQNIVYRVNDFAAEVGFFIDILGLPVIAFDAFNAIFTSPDEDFSFSVLPTPPDGECTPPDAICIQFLISNLVATTQELENRGVVFDEQPFQLAEGSELYASTFRTPHGITIELWGVVEPKQETNTDEWEPVFAAEGKPVFTPAAAPEAALSKKKLPEAALPALGPPPTVNETEPAPTPGPRRFSPNRSERGFNFRAGSRPAPRPKPPAPLVTAETPDQEPVEFEPIPAAPLSRSQVAPPEAAESAEPLPDLDVEYTPPDEAEEIEDNFSDELSEEPTYDDEETGANTSHNSFFDPMDRFRGNRIRPRNQRRKLND